MKVHLKWRFTWNGGSLEMKVHLKWRFTWNRGSLEMEVHLKWRFTWNSNTNPFHSCFSFFYHCYKYWRKLNEFLRFFKQEKRSIFILGFNLYWRLLTCNSGMKYKNLCYYFLFHVYKINLLRTLSNSLIILSENDRNVRLLSYIFSNITSLMEEVFENKKMY